jgi:dienelactone hydrolase
MLGGMQELNKSREPVALLSWLRRRLQFKEGVGSADGLGARRTNRSGVRAYGSVPKDAERFLAGACPIVGSYGAKDRTLRGAADRLERALTTNGVDHDVKEYPDAGHSFLNDHDPADASTLFVLLGKIAGGGYHEPAAEDARRRIAAFFNTHLKAQR